MVSILASSVVDRGICCSSVKHTTLRGKRKDWMGLTQDNVSVWSGMSPHQRSVVSERERERERERAL